MPKIDRYEQLVAWQFANELADLVDAMTTSGDASRNQSFREQLLKASAKAPAQIAEGFLRFKPRESAYYYRIARASIGETQTHLQRGRRRGYWTDDVFTTAWRVSDSALKTTTGLLLSRLARIKQEERDEQQRKRQRGKAPEQPRGDL